MATVRKKAKREPRSPLTTVDFRVGDQTYQIDPDRRKVYRKFVEIETSRAIEIFSVWRSQAVQV